MPEQHLLPERRPSLRNGGDLAAAGLIPPERAAAIDAVALRYSMAITPTLAGLIDPNDPNDPIARQFIPDPAELENAPDECDDPIGDISHSPLKGVIHRYPDRLLLTPVLRCPLYCRFCFRRGWTGEADGALSDAEMEAALDYVRSHDEIWEVILSGGDPLMLPSSRLKALIGALNAIPHVAVIRIHSRIPIGDPGRVGPALIDALTGDTALWLALHCNHPRELGPDAAAACRRLSAVGIPLLGQTVLLGGVNDDEEVMEALFRAMVKNRIKPYYLHHLDAAPGTRRFHVPLARGQTIMRHLRGRVSGLCPPTYVLDIPGGHGKVPIGPAYLEEGFVQDWQGHNHKAPD
ncbi:MAG: lysine-2,3-aminomutase-like protein [Rhodospirillaceae bacterium]|nr:lysine-2,3-aminomutase-like protein [Rhodospirillaceae bacterium]